MDYVYILTNRWGNVFYTGITNDLERRLEEHRAGDQSGFTKKYNVDRLIYYEEYSDVNVAIAREKEIKGWNRNKKLAMIEKVNPNWRVLARLSS